MKQTRNKTKPTEPPADYSPGWLEALDGRLSLAKDMRARFAEICSDLGGAEQLSYMQRSLVERCLWSEYWIGQQERNLAGGLDIDMGRYTQAVNALSGLYNKLGIERRTKDAPDLQSWIKERNR